MEMSRRSTAIKRVHSDNAYDFIQNISPRGPYFGKEPNPSPWIFRGHANASWGLMPSALRLSERDRLHEIARTSEVVRAKKNTHIAQMIAELSVLRQLEVELDQQGLGIPQHSLNLTNSLRTILEKFPNDYSLDSPLEWPQDDLVGLMSLAQHYGLPTRLLDWTRSAFIAAYFAVEPNRLIHDVGHDNACVWALDTSGSEGGISMRNSPDLKVVFVPRNINPYLHAQHGLFTMYTMFGSPAFAGRAIAFLPIEEAILGFDESDCFTEDHLFLIQFTFPRSEAGKVLWLLEKEMVTASQLFPGHMGAATAVRERMYSSPITDPTRAIG